MGRTKKVKTEEVLEETKTPSTPVIQDSVGYSGTVTVTITKDKKILSKRTSHNQGGKPLFDFLAYCLAGRYSAATECIPYKIMLFETSANSPILFDPTLNNTSVSEFKALEGDTDFDEATSINGNVASVTYHFRVPYSWITKDNAEIKVLALYGKNTSKPEGKSIGNYTAYYKLVDEKGDWAPIEISNTKSTNLIVDWTLSVTNQNQNNN